MASPINIEKIGKECLRAIKSASWFPYKTGHLMNDAVGGVAINSSTFEIKFDSSIAEYIPYLEEGTQPHDIPFAFVGKGNWVWWYPYDDGVPFLFGMGGRFNGKFHSGSTKHQGFISVKSVNAIVNYIKNNYGGEIK